MRSSWVRYSAAAKRFSSACTASPSAKFSGLKKWVKVVCTVLFIQASCDIACARAHDSAGSSPTCG